MNLKDLPICTNCYWDDGYRCEIYYQNYIYRNCPNFLNDRIHSKNVKQWLLCEPHKAKNNWRFLDEVDRRKYYEMYGD